MNKFKRHIPTRKPVHVAPVAQPEAPPEPVAITLAISEIQVESKVDQMTELQQTLMNAPPAEKRAIMDEIMALKREKSAQNDTRAQLKALHQTLMTALPEQKKDVLDQIMALRRSN